MSKFTNIYFKVITNDKFLQSITNRSYFHLETLYIFVVSSKIRKIFI